MGRVQVLALPRLDAEFDYCFDQLTLFVDLSEVDDFHPTRGNAVHTTSVVLG